MSEVAWRAKSYVRRYVEEDRVRTLCWFLLVSFVIAAVEWSLSRGSGSLWPTASTSFETYFAVLSVFAFAWAVVVIAGIAKCGWPGLLMLVPIKWGLFPIYLVMAIYFSCLLRQECL